MGLTVFPIPAPDAAGLVLLSTTTLSGSSTAITGISQDYENLYITINDWYASNAGDFQLRVNNNSTASAYQTTYIGGDAGSSAVITGVATTDNFTLVGAASVQAADNNNAGVIWLYDYANTTARKLIQSQTGFKRNFGSHEKNAFTTGWWNNNAAINEINLITPVGTFSQGTVKIYGVK